VKAYGDDPFMDNDSLCFGSTLHQNSCSGLVDSIYYTTSEREAPGCANPCYTMYNNRLGLGYTILSTPIHILEELAINARVKDCGIVVQSDLSDLSFCCFSLCPLST
jgi:hypothetical protein